MLGMQNIAPWCWDHHDGFFLNLPFSHCFRALLAVTERLEQQHRRVIQKMQVLQVGHHFQPTAAACQAE